MRGSAAANSNKGEEKTDDKIDEVRGEGEEARARLQTVGSLGFKEKSGIRPKNGLQEKLRWEG